jgi:hypothetical protein
MIPPYDIFKVETTGSRWIEAAATLEDAKACVQRLGALSPGEYLIMSQKTGNKLVIKLDSAAGTPEGVGDSA